MLDKRKLEDELTKGFIYHEYSLHRSTFDMTGYEQKAIEMYRNDPIFNRRVRSIVSRVLATVDNCLVKSGDR